MAPTLLNTRGRHGLDKSLELPADFEEDGLRVLIENPWGFHPVVGLASFRNPPSPLPLHSDRERPRALIQLRKEIL